jgi:hypothetical protein
MGIVYCFCSILTKELNENTNKSTKWRENMMLTLRSIQFCHANNKQVLWLVQFWQDFQTSQVLLIPNCTSNIT